VTDAIPTLYEWMGGMPAIERLLEEFYRRVPGDPLIGQLFASLKPDHARHVAAFFAEVLGGPKVYSETRGGHPGMVRHHLDLGLTEAQRSRWMQLLLQCADELGIPSDPEFRSALVGYLEWGSRLAVINAQPGASVDEGASMPRWGWGETKGPYRPGS
jgi:hemoglobin